MRIAYAILPVLCALAAAVSTAEQTQSEVAPVALYKSPKVIEWGRVPYPKVDLTGVHEGWAIVNLMVDPEGNPYEATIVESIGGPAFEKAALAQALKSRFEPASMSGTPIHAGTSVKLYFQVPGIPQDLKIRDEYPMQFQEVLKAVVAGDRERADAKLARLDAHNLYEDAYRAIAEFAYYLRWGTEAQQISALRRRGARSGRSRSTKSSRCATTTRPTQSPASLLIVRHGTTNC
jgi:TonB family protein